MPKCFVIQPFDKGKYDKRYSDVFEKAIRAAGFEPYRVDRDPAVEIPIDQIEEQIRDADICLAEISTDNPNVWFELGFAVAVGKSVVMVSCTTERTGKFPFDVQHRRVITYESDSPKDFSALGKKITEQLSARSKGDNALRSISENQPTKEMQGLKNFEIAALSVLAGEHTTADWTSGAELKHRMEKFGYTPHATTLAVYRLIALKFVEEGRETADVGETFKTFSPTAAGLGWLSENVDKLTLQHSPQPMGQAVDKDAFDF